MPVDLDRMFAALGADADAIAAAPPTAPRRRGECRRRAQLGLVALAVASLLLAVTGGATWLAGPSATPDPAHPTGRPRVPERPVDFRPLRPVGPGVDFGAPVRHATSSIEGGVAYLGWLQEDGDLRVAALDTTTGRPRWPARTLGRYDEWNGISALPQGLLAVGVNDHQSSQLVVVDPATGATRWRQDLAHVADLLTFDAAVVLRTRAGTQALDWRTGARLWFAAAGTDPPVSGLGIRRAGEVGWFGRHSGIAARAAYHDGPLLQLTVSGRLVARDVRTGRVVAPPRRVVTLAGDEAVERGLAYDGRILLVTRTPSAYRLVVAELAGPDAHRVIHTAPVVDSGPDRTVICGGGALVCVVESPEPAEGAELVAIHLDLGALAWRARIPAPTVLAPAGDRVLYAGGERGAGVLDGAGRTALAPGGSESTAGWVTSGGVLEFAGSAQDRHIEVFGVSAPAWRRQSLGRIPVQPYGCAWNERYLTCPVEDGFKVWRFT